MINLFKPEQAYVLGDPELDVIGSREKLAQWRFRKVGPAWVKIGRKVTYLGVDLNTYISANRTDPNKEAAK
ncbi:MAG: MerR family transcriptional regulator [Amylibacter sp.]|nr:MerR family transcriptional regulator [Amylibacter sp.]